jgi:hypothetical protein
VDALLALAAVTRDDLVVDLGAGDGRVCVQACLAHGAAAWGVEIDAAEASKFRSNVAAFNLEGEKPHERLGRESSAPGETRVSKTMGERANSRTKERTRVRAVLALAERACARACVLCAF